MGSLHPGYARHVAGTVRDIDPSADAEDPGALPGLTVLDTLAADDRVVVHLAQQHNPDRKVRLVVLRDTIADPEAWARFRREARVASIAGHEALATVYSAGRTATGLPFVVMEHTEGGSLQGLIERDAALRPEAVRRIGETLCEAVAAAHERGIVHGAITPADVLLDRGGTVRLAGFGISAARRESVAEADDVRGIATTLLAVLVGRRAPNDRPVEHDASQRAALVGLLETCLGDPHERPSVHELGAGLAGLKRRRFANVAPASPYRVIQRPPTAIPMTRPEAWVADRPDPRRLALALWAGLALAAVALGFVLGYRFVDRAGEDAAPTSGGSVLPGATATVPSSTSTAPPATAAPSTAPATTAVPVTVAPAITEAPAGGSSATLPPSASDEAAFVRTYYDIVNAEDYARGWAMLSPQFQDRTGSFNRYVQFWQRWDVEILDAQRVGTTEDGASVVHVRAVYVSDNRRTEETDELTVQRLADGGFRIVAQRVIG